MRKFNSFSLSLSLPSWFTHTKHKRIPCKIHMNLSYNKFTPWNLLMGEFVMAPWLCALLFRAGQCLPTVNALVVVHYEEKDDDDVHDDNVDDECCLAYLERTICVYFCRRLERDGERDRRPFDKFTQNKFSFIHGQCKINVRDEYFVDISLSAWALIYFLFVLGHKNSKT